MQQFVPLRTTAKDGTIDFEIVTRLEDQKKNLAWKLKSL